MHTLKNFYIYLTWNCNLYCKHCWVNAKKEDNSKLDYNIALSACKDAILLGARYIKFSGGEPLLYADEVISLAENIKKLNQNISLHLETNATLVDTNLAKKLKIFDSVSVSLDSANPDVHNAIRGKKTAFDDAIKGIKNIVENDIDITVTSVISDPEKIDLHIQEMICLLKDLRIKILKINPIMNNGRAFNDSHSFYNVDPIDMIDIQNRYIGEKDVRVVIMLPCAYNLNLVDVGSSKFHTCDCLSLLSLLPNGNVGLCGEARKASEFTFGNINDNSLADIWKSSYNLNILRDTIPNKLEGVCGKCAIKNICKGGCRVDGFLSGGTLASPSYICQQMYDRGLFHLAQTTDKRV